jgi:hypothetical protein
MLAVERACSVVSANYDLRAEVAPCTFALIAERPAVTAERWRPSLPDLGSPTRGPPRTTTSSLTCLPSERDRRPRQVRVGRMPAAVPRHRRHLRHQCFFAGAQRVRFSPQDVVQVERVLLEPRCRCDPLVYGRRVHRQDLGLEECPGRACLRPELDDLIAHALRGGHARVLVGLQAGVGGQPVECLVLREVQVERGLQARRRLRQRPLECRGRGEVLLDPCPLGAPRIVGGVQVGQIPLVLVRRRRARALLGADAGDARGDENA